MIPNGTVGRQPHLLELELLDSGFVWCDGSALDTDRVFLDGLCGINGHLVVGLIPVGQTEIVVFQIDIKISPKVSINSKRRAGLAKEEIHTGR